MGRWSLIRRNCQKQSLSFSSVITLIISYPLKPFSKHDVDASWQNSVADENRERGEGKRRQEFDLRTLEKKTGHRPKTGYEPLHGTT